eukprot:TRINITY_DN29422_c0_g1_i1.p1 TRINITY_DN29422_c0_g1~~TRINITY_DN29422_c0_g1_i1.p1  ORF type:complete len:103 (-),score=14.84 TRINITY_DN29422_c0_g1_i1:779-1087(-)
MILRTFLVVFSVSLKINGGCNCKKRESLNWRSGFSGFCKDWIFRNWVFLEAKSFWIITLCASLEMKSGLQLSFPGIGNSMMFCVGAGTVDFPFHFVGAERRN